MSSAFKGDNTEAMPALRANFVLPAAFLAAVVSRSSAFMPVGSMLGCSPLARCGSLASVSRRPVHFARSNLAGTVPALRAGALGLQAGVLDGFSAKDIDGNQVDLGATFGNVPAVLVVNLASK